MPFPNEHAARQTDPGKYDEFRRTHPEGWPKGIDAVWGVTLKPTRTLELQSVRFDRKLWTVAAARAWLKQHDLKATIEEATSKGVNKCAPLDWSGII